MGGLARLRPRRAGLSLCVRLLAVALRTMRNSLRTARTDTAGRFFAPGETAGHNGVRSGHTIGFGGAPAHKTAGHNGVRSRHTIDRLPAKPQVIMVCSLDTPLFWCVESTHPVCALDTPEHGLRSPENDPIRSKTAGHNGVCSRHTIELMVCRLDTPLRTQKNSKKNSSLTGSAPSARTGCPTGSPSESTLDTPPSRPNRCSLIWTPSWEPEPHQRARSWAGPHGSHRTASDALRGRDRPPTPLEGPERLLWPPAASRGDLDVLACPAGGRTG